MKKSKHLHADIDSQIETLVDSMFKAVDPKELSSFSSETQKEARKALASVLSGKTTRERMEDGFSLIFHELAAHEPPIVVSNIFSNWESCIKKVLEEGKKHNLSPSEEEHMSSFQEKFSISEETIIAFYNCGLRLYERQLYEQASDVFFSLSFIDYKRHNVWTALGLSEKKRERWQPALAAFSIAILTDIQDPLSFLYSAECYIFLGQPLDANECIEKALQLLQNTSDANTQELTDYALTLKKSA